MSISAVTHLWRSDPYFKRTVREILELESGQLKELASLASSGFALTPESASILGLNEFPLTVGALRTMYRSAKGHDDGPAGIIRELQDLVGSEESTRDLRPDWEALEDLLQRKPEADRAVSYETTQRSFFPVLEYSKFTVDMRVSDEDEDAMVPVVLARFEFDESIQVGDAISFQLTDASFEVLESEIERIRELRRKVESVFEDKIRGDD